MPDASGRFRGISVPELPWQQGTKLESTVRYVYGTLQLEPSAFDLEPGRFADVVENELDDLYASLEGMRDELRSWAAELYVRHNTAVRDV